jgi:hypothetical protein
MASINLILTGISTWTSPKVILESDLLNRCCLNPYMTNTIWLVLQLCWLVYRHLASLEILRISV